MYLKLFHITTAVDVISFPYSSITLKLSSKPEKDLSSMINMFNGSDNSYLPFALTSTSITSAVTGSIPPVGCFDTLLIYSPACA